LTWAYLRRGLAAGLLAGLLAGLFAYLFAEPTLDRAIELESAAHAGEHGEAVFDRGEQKSGLILATALYGTSVGALFGLLSAFFRTRSRSRSEWRRSLTLAGAVFLGAVLLPFLKYPPNPPGVGADPSTLTERTLAYLALAALGLLAVLAAWRFIRAASLEGASRPLRVLASGAVLLGLWTFLYLAMPDFGGAVSDTGHAPAGLIRDFRLSSLGTQVVLWAGIGCVFGLLGERASRRGAL
jgi:predicted cobalt transporter CbtA